MPLSSIFGNGVFTLCYAAVVADLKQGVASTCHLQPPAAPALDAASARTGRFRQNSRSRRGLGCRGVGPALLYTHGFEKLENETALKICLSS